MKLLSYGKQQISSEDIQAVVDVLKSDYLTQGPKVKEFEDAICRYTQAKYAVAVSSGTAALHLSVAALKIEKGKIGITSPNSFVASANCLIYNGLKPYFADIDPRTYNIDPREIRKKLSKDTKVLIPVHFAGQPADLREIYKIAKDNNLFVIEDASHAIGSMYKHSKIGSCKYSDMTVFSFHPVKTMTTGEGGMITTNDKTLYDRLMILRTHGITRNPALFVNKEDYFPGYYEMHELGFNYRLTDIQAALGISQLQRLDEFVKRRRKIVHKYNQVFKNLSNVQTPFESQDVYSAFHLYVLLIDFNKIGYTRNKLILELKSKKIGTQVHYIPINRQPFYSQNYNLPKEDYTNAEDYYNKALSIPLYPNMKDSEVKYVIDTILQYIK